MDVLKVRLQMQGADGTKQYSGLIDAGMKTVRSEGIGALYKGQLHYIIALILGRARSRQKTFRSCDRILDFSFRVSVRCAPPHLDAHAGVEPALIRQVVYGGLRYGLYAPIRNAIGVDANTPKDKIPFHLKFAAGASAGGLASFIANPTGRHLPFLTIHSGHAKQSAERSFNVSLAVSNSPCCYWFYLMVHTRFRESQAAS